MNRSFKLVLGLLASCAIVIFSWPELPTFAHEGETSSASSASSIDKVAEAYGDARVLRNSFLRGIARFKKTADSTDIKDGKIHYQKAQSTFNNWIDEEVFDLVKGGKGTDPKKLMKMQTSLKDASQKLTSQRKAQIVDSWVKIYSLALANEPFTLTSISNSDEEKAKLLSGFNDTLGNFEKVIKLTKALADRGIWIVQLGRLKLPNFEDVPAESAETNLMVLDPQKWPVLVKQNDEKGGGSDSTLTAGDSKDKTYGGGEYSPFPRIAPSALRIRTSDPYYKFDENDSIKMSDFARMNSRGVHLMPQNHSIPRSVRSDMAP